MPPRSWFAELHGKSNRLCDLPPKRIRRGRVASGWSGWRKRRVVWAWRAAWWLSRWPGFIKQGADRCLVVTQGRNIAAQKALPALRLSPTRSLELWYHKWFAAEPFRHAGNRGISDDRIPHSLQQTRLRRPRTGLCKRQHLAGAYLRRWLLHPPLPAIPGRIAGRQEGAADDFLHPRAGDGGSAAGLSSPATKSSCHRSPLSPASTPLSCVARSQSSPIFARIR